MATAFCQETESNLDNFAENKAFQKVGAPRVMIGSSWGRAQFLTTALRQEPRVRFQKARQNQGFHTLERLENIPRVSCRLQDGFEITALTRLVKTTRSERLEQGRENGRPEGSEAKESNKREKNAVQTGNNDRSKEAEPKVRNLLCPPVRSTVVRFTVLTR